MEKTKKPFLIAFAGIVALSMLAVMPAPGSAATINVPGDCKTIQEAIDKAENGDTVLVAPDPDAGGIYKESIVMKSGVTVQGSGADVTTIQGVSSVWHAVKGAPNSTISGFTITGYYYGIYNSNHCSPTITNNIITGSRKGIYNNDYSSPTITNNIISGNANDGISSFSNSSPTITNNTITGNGYSGIYNDSTSSPTITNNIISGNTEYGIESAEGSSPQIKNNDVVLNGDGSYLNCSPGAGDISADPEFVDPDNGDYHLKEGSPCIDSGTDDVPGLPETDADGNTRIVDGDGDGVATVDMGAFEYQVAKANAPINCFKVNYVKVIDRTRYGAKRDKIKIGGSLELPEEAFDPEVDVTVTINDKVIIIQPEPFKGKHFLWLHYYCFRGDIGDVRVHMHLNFNRCRWWVKIYGMETSDLVRSETATVELKIGKNVGDESFEWTKRWEGRRIGFARFIEWPPIRCCGRWWWWR
ncbi:MAG: right-handed parallel beta-helix repeat-containing protein [Desulfobacterales bacterium]|nr:right-handed parallel beta-helix repeat-containing protein [Desulfobacterales bacterium]